MKKKILVHIAILLILTGGFCNVYIKGLSVSSCGNQLSAFAADDTYSWESVSKDDLVTAFKYYCKSRNLAIEGSIADAVTSFTTTTFNNLCNTLGIDSDSLQAELKKTTGGNLGLRFLFTQTGVNAYNRIFAEFLQNNNFSEGDSIQDDVIYSGDYFTDSLGNGCYVFVVSKRDVSFKTIPNTDIIKYGTPYRFIGLNFFNSHDAGTYSFTCNDLDFTLNVVKASSESYVSVSILNQPIYRDARSQSSNYAYQEGYTCIVKYGNDYYLGRYCKGSKKISSDNPSPSFIVENCYFTTSSLITDTDVQNGDIYVTTNNNTINNNTYNNNYTIIYNDGDYYDYDDDDEPDPSTPPGGGGGGGGDDPDPDEPPIVDPTPTPDPTVPDWDIELPDLPVGNEWLLYGLEKKFPWDIPFNLMYMLSLFAADPETPHFQGTLDLKVVQWDYDIDLAPFDDIARNVRNFEFVGFIIGLMLLTRKLIWG